MCVGVCVRVCVCGCVCLGVCVCVHTARVCFETWGCLIIPLSGFPNKTQRGRMMIGRPGRARSRRGPAETRLIEIQLYDSEHECTVWFLTEEVYCAASRRGCFGDRGEL